MVASDSRFTGSIPEIYDRLLVPLLFDAYASDLADRLAKINPNDILETAAGTGALTRVMASCLPKQTRIVATDLNQPMLDHAITRTPEDARIDWQQADALTLPYSDQSFDAVICQFGVMFFPDKVRGYKEARRVLKPGGTYLFSVWDRISENAFANVVSETLAEMFPKDPPSFISRTPHGYYDVETIHGELTAAGFTSVRVEIQDHVAKAVAARDIATAFCQGTPIRNEIEARDPLRLEEATRMTADALARKFGNGPVEGQVRALLFSAIR